MEADNSRDEFAISFGVEEEFFLVDPDTLNLAAEPDERIFDHLESNQGPHRYVRELLRTQLETNTRVCASMAEVRQALVETRRTALVAAEAHGASILASSTHPFALWAHQTPTPKERYRRFVMTFQEAVRRILIGGMHVHAGFGDPDSRIRVMTAIRRFLPVLHALSTSSPFNEGRLTGFKSFRLNLLGNLPRTTVPRPMENWEQFQVLVDELKAAEFINDASELWWDIRPSHAYPTIEMRICDVCTKIEDAMCIVAMYGCLIRFLWRLDCEGGLPPEPLTEVILENRWLAQRYGIFAHFGDPESSGRKDIGDVVEDLVEMLDEDAVALDCRDDLQRALAIVREGTGADRQVDLFRLRMLNGESTEEILPYVVEMIMGDFKEGVS